MYNIKPGEKLILASASPRRQDMLRSLSIPFAVVSPDIDETELPGETAEELVQRLSRAKAEAIAAGNAAAWILAADVVVVVSGEILCKPRDPEHAVEMLNKIQGRIHHVVGSFSIICKKKNIIHTELHDSEVEIAPLTAQQIRAYVASKEPLDKAGAYAIQGLGAPLVRRISGSYTNVVGMNFSAVVSQLLRLGVLEVA